MGVGDDVGPFVGFGVGGTGVGNDVGVEVGFGVGFGVGAIVGGNSAHMEAPRSFMKRPTLHLSHEVAATFACARPLPQSRHDAQPTEG